MREKVIVQQIGLELNLESFQQLLIGLFSPSCNLAKMQHEFLKRALRLRILEQNTNFFVSSTK